jgi:hypothetical protein
MKKTLITAVLALAIAGGAICQTMAPKPKVITETMLILPKRGMEDKFEAAVKAHNSKFHGDGPNVAGLRKIEYGEKSNWYVWVHGPTSYASLDTPPTRESGHQADWDTNVEPLVDAYGESMIWERNDELSFGADILQKSKYYEVWSVKLKAGEYKRFKAICEKLKKTYESMGTQAFVILDNALHQAKGADVAMIWSFNSFDKWGNDTGTMGAYEKLYGAGSWQAMVDEWNAVKVDYSSEIRSFVR